MRSIFMNIKRILFTSIMILNIVFMSGCNVKSTNDMDQVKEDNKIKIGFCMDTFFVERWQKDVDSFVTRVKELGGEVLIQNANNDSKQQMDQAAYLIDQGIDVLVIIPHDFIEAADIVNMAKKKGVKVIAYDRLISKANVDLYMSFDSEKNGSIMASALVKKVGKGNYVIFNGAKSDYNSYLLNKGFKSVIQSKIDTNEIHIIKEIWLENWRPEGAFKCIEEILQQGIKIDGIIAANDTIAGSAIEALSEKRLAGAVAVVGHDADLDGCQRIVEGTQLMTIYKPINKLAIAAAEAAIKLAKGDDLSINNKIYDGKYSVPFYIIESTEVNKENMMDTIIKSGFHKKDEVYKYTKK